MLWALRPPPPKKKRRENWRFLFHVGEPLPPITGISVHFYCKLLAILDSSWPVQ